MPVTSVEGNSFALFFYICISYPNHSSIPLSLPIIPPLTPSDLGPSAFEASAPSECPVCLATAPGAPPSRCATACLTCGEYFCAACYSKVRRKQSGCSQCTLVRFGTRVATRVNVT